MSVQVFSFTRPSPTLVLQAANAGVRRPGYEAMSCFVESSENNKLDGKKDFFSPLLTMKEGLLKLNYHWMGRESWHAIKNFSTWHS